MLSEKVLFALNNVEDSFLEEARMLMDGPAAVQQSGRKRTVRVFLIAAILAALMGASAYAVKTSVASPEAAKKVALQEIEVWKEMGLLSPDICFEGEPNNIVEITSGRLTGSTRYRRKTLFSASTAAICGSIR